MFRPRYNPEPLHKVHSIDTPGVFTQYFEPPHCCFWYWLSESLSIDSTVYYQDINLVGLRSHLSLLYQENVHSYRPGHMALVVVKLGGGGSVT